MAQIGSYKNRCLPVQLEIVNFCLDNGEFFHLHVRTTCLPDSSLVMTIRKNLVLISDSYTRKYTV